MEPRAPNQIGTCPTDVLVTLSARGDQEAFRVLVDRHQQYAFAVGFRLLCDEQEARDVAQESFIRVWRHCAEYDPSIKFTTWLYRIVTNLAYDRLRAAQRRRRFFLDARDVMPAEPSVPPEQEDAAINRDLAARIRALAEQLPLKQRLVFVLRDLQDLAVEEVSDILCMSPATIKVNLCYARRKIRERLQQCDAL